MTSTIRPIETRYAGCRFRSRLEARWAVFFDTLGVRWEYEPEGFDIDGRLYLPDFLLPDCGTWVEVKGSENFDKAFLLKAAEALPKMWNGRGESGPAFMVLGPHPQPHPHGGDWGWRGFDHGHLGWWGFGEYRKNDRPWWLDGSYCYGDHCNFCSEFPDEVERDVAVLTLAEMERRGVRAVVVDGRLRTNGPVGAIGPSLAARIRLCRDHIIEILVRQAGPTAAAWLTPTRWPDEPSVEFAYTAARSARFEHGENG